jgi:hypothetical protein
VSSNLIAGLKTIDYKLAEYSGFLMIVKEEAGLGLVLKLADRNCTLTWRHAFIVGGEPQVYDGA